MRKKRLKIKISILTVFFCFFIFINIGKEEFIPCLVSVLLHEAGHIVAILTTCEKINCITVYPCGIDIKMGGRMLSYGEEIFVALAGPFVSLSLFLLFCALGRDTWRDANLIYLMLNCLPVKYFDGGRALYSFICIVSDETKAERISCFLSYCFIFLLWAVAVYAFFVTNGNFSLLMMIICIFFRSIFTKKDV